MTQRKRKRAESQAAGIAKACISAVELGEADDGDLVLVLATCAADSSTSMTAWPTYLDHGKRVRALLEMAFKRACAEGEGKST